MPIRQPNPTLAAAAMSCALGLGGLGVTASGALAQALPPLTAADKPRELEGVGITEHLNQIIPLDLPFKDETGREVRLRDYFKSGCPVILVPGYYRCPQLCNLTRSGLIDAMNGIDWSAGKEFQVLFVSIDPTEQPELASVKKEAMLEKYPRGSAKDGLHFLVGGKREIQLLTEAIGFGYRYDPVIDNYAHTATIMFLTPDGRLSRYMNDVAFQSRDVRLALIESSEGAIGSPMDKFLLFMCYHYDPLRQSYAASAVKIMRLGGLVTLTLLVAGLGVLWLKGTPRRTAIEKPAMAALGLDGGEVKT